MKKVKNTVRQKRRKPVKNAQSKDRGKAPIEWTHSITTHVGDPRRFHGRHIILLVAHLKASEARARLGIVTPGSKARVVDLGEARRLRVAGLLGGMVGVNGNGKVKFVARGADAEFALERVRYVLENLDVDDVEAEVSSLLNREEAQKIYKEVDRAALTAYGRGVTQPVPEDYPP